MCSVQERTEFGMCRTIANGKINAIKKNQGDTMYNVTGVLISYLNWFTGFDSDSSFDYLLLQVYFPQITTTI